MSDSEWAKRVEQVNFALIYTGLRELTPEGLAELIEEENKILGPEEPEING